MNSKQRAYLRKLAQTMEPILHIGKSSITPEFTKAIDEALEARELIKINVLKNCFDDVKELANVLADRTQSEVVHVMGRKIVLYRESKDNPKIKIWCFDTGRIMKNKIAILGGTFDPIHLGHIKMAEAVLNETDVDEIYFMPSKIPPHKLNKVVTDEIHRCNMVKLAIEDNDKFVFSDYDISRDEPSYTALTLTGLKEANKDLDIYFIIGGDSLRDIEKWFKPEVVMANCTLLTIARDEVDASKMNELINDLKSKYTCNIIPINMDMVNISSSNIRNKLVINRDYESYENVLDKKVFDYIIKNNLYLNSDCKISLANESDKDEILSLYKAQIGRKFCPWNDDYPSMETIEFDLERDSLFVLRNEEKIIAAISVDEDEDVEKLDCWSENLSPAGELSRLAVLPSYQNKGIAKLMLNFGMKELKNRGFKGFHFLVNKYNKKALKSYSAFNFTKVGECHLFDQDFLCYETEL